MELTELMTRLGILGLIILAFSWFFRHKDSALNNKLAVVGWALTASYFFADAIRYYGHGDLVLTVLSLATLPLAVLVIKAELSPSSERQRQATNWIRGAVAFAGGPYILIAHMPGLNVLAIYFVASQSVMMLKFAGGGDVRLGETWVQTSDGYVTWEAWQGSKWFTTNLTGEYPIHTELILADGSMIGVNFVLACTALQSMVVFIGAISVLDISWKRRCRALMLTIPLIHILNLFRNAGLIWLHTTYTEWSFYGMSVFDFGHLYAARFVSLLAMFAMALVMFDILPEMHRHIRTLMPKKAKARPAA